MGIKRSSNDNRDNVRITRATRSAHRSTTNIATNSSIGGNLHQIDEVDQIEIPAPGNS